MPSINLTYYIDANVLNQIGQAVGVNLLSRQQGTGEGTQEEEDVAEIID